MCWASHRDFTERRMDHKPFLTCAKKPGYVKNAYGWIDLKRTIKFKDFQYCFSCQLPQEAQYRLDNHPPVISRAPCLLQDFAIQIIWFIQHNETWWLDAINAFPELTETMGKEEFSCWLNLDWDGFYNGLEMWNSRVIHMEWLVLCLYISGVGIDINI